MPTAKQASPSGGTASPAAALQMCAGLWGWRLHGGELFWFCRKEMVSPSFHPAVQPNEVARWDVRGDGHRVGNLAPGSYHPSPSPMGLGCRDLRLSLPAPQQWGNETKRRRFYPVDKALWKPDHTFLTHCNEPPAKHGDTISSDGWPGQRIHQPYLPRRA